MTPPKRIIGAIAAAGTLAVALPGNAGATPAGNLTFQQTFPLASTLCAKVAAGTEGKHLKAAAAQVTADCETLLAEFTAAHNAVLAARASIEPALAADRASLRAACPNPKVVHAACRKAHRLDDKAIVSLLHQRQAARHSYYKAIEAARAQFWAQIHLIRGEHHVKADTPIPVPPA
jgi:hypothetical protein